MTATTTTTDASDEPPLAFETFYARARDGCLRAVVLTTGDRHTADDLVAEAFARAWARWPAVRRHPAPEAWVVRTALNLRVSWWRRLRREVPSLEDDDAGRCRGAASASAHGLPDVGQHAHEEQLDLRAAVAELPERQRQVLALRVYLDLDTRQTADALGIAEGTVTAHLHRATSALRARLMEPTPSATDQPASQTTGQTTRSHP